MTHAAIVSHPLYREGARPVSGRAAGTQGSRIQPRAGCAAADDLRGRTGLCSAVPLRGGGAVQRFAGGRDVVSASSAAVIARSVRDARHRSDRDHGRTDFRDTKLLRHIGGTLLIQHTTVGRVEVGEKPEILWERPDLERLYVRLEDEYELRERHVALERKLELISRTAETLLNLMQHKRSLRVEWYIVILIMAEIALSLIDKFLLR